MPLRVVVDALPARGMSLAIVVEELLRGWARIDEADELHLVVPTGSPLAPPGTFPRSVAVHTVPVRRPVQARRVAAQWQVVPRLCREIGADAMLGSVPASTMAPLPCPRVVIAYDLRYRHRPAQFDRRARWLKEAGNAIGYRQADAVCCISDRTRRDLLDAHPFLRHRPVAVTHLGADHVDSWPVPSQPGGYALAFGQYGNKNVDLVLRAWSLLSRQGDAVPLVLVGIPDDQRGALGSQVAELGLADLVTLLPWLAADDLHRRFAGAGVVVFPSDFEGFGLPAVEAMRLGIPVVVSPDRALLEVTGGHATVMAGWDAPDLARAVVAARGLGTAALEAARTHAARFTWRSTAEQVRSVLVEAAATHRRSPQAR